MHFDTVVILGKKQIFSRSIPSVSIIKLILNGRYFFVNIIVDSQAIIGDS